MIKTRLCQLASAIILLAASSTASASLFKVEFLASAFTPARPTAAIAPVDSVSGNFVYRANAQHDVIEELLGVSLTVNGHAYALPDVGLANAGSQFLIGGSRTGVTGLTPNTHDFLFIFDPDQRFRGHFAFITASAADLWRSGKVSFDVRPVPEPSSFGLMLTMVFASVAFQRRPR